MKIIFFFISFNILAQDVIFINDHDKNQCIKAKTQIFKILDVSHETYKVELYEKTEEVFNGEIKTYYSSEGVKILKFSTLDKFPKTDCSVLL